MRWYLDKFYVRNPSFEPTRPSEATLDNWALLCSSCILPKAPLELTSVLVPRHPQVLERAMMEYLHRPLPTRDWTTVPATAVHHPRWWQTIHIRYLLDNYHTLRLQEHHG